MPPQTTNYNGQQMGTAMAQFLKNNPTIANQNQSLQAANPANAPKPPALDPNKAAPLTAIVGNVGGAVAPDIAPGYTFKGQVSNAVDSSKIAQDDYNTKYGQYINVLNSVAQQQQQIQQRNAAAAQQAKESQTQASLDNQQGIVNNQAQQKIDLERQKLQTKDKLISSINASPGSIVDFLKQQGEDSSLQNRANLAVQHGLVSSADEYISLANQGANGQINTQLLAALQGGAAGQGAPALATSSQNPAVQQAEQTTAQSLTPGDDAAYAQALLDLNIQSEQAYNDFKNQIEQIRNGTYPLSQSEQALIDSVQSSLDRAKAQQELANKAYVGGVTQQAFREGLSEYSPTIGKGQIFNAVSAGVAKIADLDAQAVEMIAKLKQGFAEDDYKLVTAEYQALTDTLKSRQDTISKIHDDVYNHAKDLANYNLDIQKFQYQQEEDERNYQMRSRESEAQIANINSQIDARNKEAKAALGALDPKVQTRVNSIVGQFDNEPIVRQFSTLQQAQSFVNSMSNKTDNPADDQALIYAFAKAMDPDSVVRESEYKTVAEYSQALFQHFGLKARRVYDNKGFLTEEARTFLKNTLDSRVRTAENSYNNLYNEYGRRIDKQTGGVDGTSYVTDYKVNNYDTYRAQLQPHEILVRDKKTGSIGAIPLDDFNKDKYDKI